ncbi:MAG: heavy metal translocating P-type ATPase [Betaproteobacteria bacterium]|nr:heavy metal translocating P-type ATPase [Betaproteobacteria bacterium]
MSSQVLLSHHPASSEAVCFHCGLPIVAGANFYVEIDGAPRAMCCAGCQAVAQAIIDSGLTDYYRHRAELPESQREVLPSELGELGLFDHPNIQKQFVRPIGEHEREADLILEGITCAACVWLNEQHLMRHRGVTMAQVNYATRRARVRWDTRETQLSELLAAIGAIGYRAHPYDPAKNEQIAQKERRSALWRLLVAGLGMMQVMMYAFPTYIARAGDMSIEAAELMRWASLILTLPVVLYSAAPFFERAWRDIRLRRLGMDVPVALGVGSAFLASLWATLTRSGEVYFDSVTMFVFLLLCGRYLEMLARQRAVRGAEAIARIVPAFAERFAAWPGELVERVPVAALKEGDVLRVRPGEAVSVDGVVLDGASEADESWLTGESRPVPKTSGSEVAAGSVNGGSPLVIRAQRVGDETRIASIRRLMERASAERPRIVEQADRIAARFVAVLLVLAFATACYWWFVDSERAIWIFASVLVVSCPCALSLATPVALTVATEQFARLGLLVTRGHAIETFARADLFVFDKTGTLTEGRMELVDVQPASDFSAQSVLEQAAALEQASEHSIGRAISRAAGDFGQKIKPSMLRAVAGQGIEAQLDGEFVRLGRESFVAEITRTPSPFPVSSGQCSEVFLGSEWGWRGCLSLSDRLRPDARAVLDALRKQRVDVAILSGDSPATVADIAKKLDVGDAKGGLLPEDKHAEVSRLQSAGHTVAMVGDGVNDAPVLAQAHVSIALGGGTELARNQADIILLGERLGPLDTGLRLAKRSLLVIRQNLAWSFVYNILAVPAAMAGMVTPWMAGIGMSASSLLVVLNALRLRRMAAKVSD